MISYNKLYVFIQNKGKIKSTIYRILASLDQATIHAVFVITGSKEQVTIFVVLGVVSIVAVYAVYNYKRGTRHFIF